MFTTPETTTRAHKQNHHIPVFTINGNQESFETPEDILAFVNKHPSQYEPCPTLGGTVQLVESKTRKTIAEVDSKRATELVYDYLQRIFSPSPNQPTRDADQP